MRPSVLIPQLVATALTLGLAWFVRQPIQGDIAIWGPPMATFLAAGAWLIAAGTLAWWWWGSYRGLALGNIAALPAIAIGSMGVLWIVSGDRGGARARVPEDRHARPHSGQCQ